MWRPRAARSSRAGFTLIEALIALTIVTMALTSIGALVATSVRGSRSVEERFLRLQSARLLLAHLPDRDELALGHISGRTESYPWRIDVSPLPGSAAGNSLWQPQQLTLTMGSPGGATISIRTIRLQRRDLP